MKAWIVGVALMTVSQTAEGDDHHHKPAAVPVTVVVARTPEDAGNPWMISNHAVPNANGHHRGYYIGGGWPFGGDFGYRDEGTFGWDYGGLVGIGPNVRLNWTHGRRYQSGVGNYKIDGPKPLEHIKSHFHGE